MLSTVWAKRLAGLAVLAAVVVASIVFNALGEAQRPATYTIEFQRGTKTAAGSEGALARAVRDASLRDEARVIVTGHSGTLGDSQANQALSRQRAQAVADRLTAEGVADARLTVVGVGGEQPLPRQADEGERAYQGRLSRVEVTVRP